MLLYIKKGAKILNTEEKIVDTARAKSVFSRIGFALIAFTAVTYLVQYPLYGLFSYLFPPLEQNLVFSLILSLASMYGAGLPVFYLIIRKCERVRGESGTARTSTILVLFVISVAFMYFGSIIGNAIYTLLGEKLGIYLDTSATSVIPLLPWYITLIFTVFVAPFFEELIFRRLIIDRIGVYGEKLAVLFSAIAFALFHMSVQQFFYAFLVGLVLGYVYVRTKKLRYCVILHALANLFGAVLSQLILQYTCYNDLLFASSPEEMMKIAAENPLDYLLIMAYSVLLLSLVAVGMVLFFIYKKKIRFEQSPQQLPPDSEGTVAFGAIGVIAFVAFSCVFPFVAAYFGI